jgi:hypothetical protein
VPRTTPELSAFTRVKRRRGRFKVLDMRFKRAEIIIQVVADALRLMNEMLQSGVTLTGVTVMIHVERGRERDIEILTDSLAHPDRAAVEALWLQEFAKDPVELPPAGCP